MERLHLAQRAGLSCIQDWTGLWIVPLDQGLHPGAAGDHMETVAEAAPYPYYPFSSSPSSQQAENPQWGDLGPRSLPREPAIQICDFT